VSREDYRRQLAGKLKPLYRPQFGFGVDAGLLTGSLRFTDSNGGDSGEHWLFGPALGFGLRWSGF